MAHLLRDLETHFPHSPEGLGKVLSPPFPPQGQVPCSLPLRVGWVGDNFFLPSQRVTGTPGCLDGPRAGQLLGLRTCSLMFQERTCLLFLTFFVSPAWCRVATCPPLTLLPVCC